MFEKASRMRLRFDINGNVACEELWDFSKEQLADYEVKLKERMEKQGKANRFAKKNDVSAKDELRLAIVSHIIDTKVAEEDEQMNAATKKQERERLLALLAKKQDEKFANLSEEEIEAKLASL